MDFEGPGNSVYGVFWRLFDKIMRTSRMKPIPIFGAAAAVLLWLTSSCIRFARAAALEQPAFVLETCLLSAEMRVQNDRAEPAEAKVVFKEGTDKNVFSFIRLKDMLGQHKLFWKWYDPSGKLYRLTDAITIGKQV